MRLSRSNQRGLPGHPAVPHITWRMMLGLRRTLGVLFGYIAISVAYFGWHLLSHPGRPLIGASGSEDPEKFVWWFAWWPHAIFSGTNPFYSHAIFAPTGINLVWTTSVPGLAFASSPVTLLFGPTVSYNVAALLLPAISAWSAFLLFGYVTRSTWASIVGGYLYGFSSYAVAHQLGGHLNLTAAFVVPLVALVVLRYLRNDLNQRGLAVRLGVLVALQAYVSTEVAVTLTMMLALALALAFAIVPGIRQRLLSSLPPILCGYAFAGVLASPLLYYGLSAGAPPSLTDASAFNADLLNLILPTSVSGLGGRRFAAVTAHFPGGLNEQNSYVGWPVLVILLLILLRNRSIGNRFLLTAFGTATLLSLGTGLHVEGHRLFWLPWSAVSRSAILNNVIPSRIALYATLAAAALVAIWIATTTGRVFRRPYVLPTLAVAALVPAFWTNSFVQSPTRLSFFSDGLYKACLPRSETLLIFPFGNTGSSMLWQAEAAFWFNMTEGDLGSHYPAGYLADPTINDLLREIHATPSHPMSEFVALARRRRVDRVVSASTLGAVIPGTSELLAGPFPNGNQMRAFGPVQQVGDVFVSPACSSRPLTRNTLNR